MRIRFAIVLGAMLAGLNAGAQVSVLARDEQVRNFVAAFNAQDADRMALMVTDDVEWLSIDGKAVATETSGREQLRTSMQKYFKSCPSCRSELVQLATSKERVATVEVASWQSRTGPRQQQGIAVYEFTGPLIRKVHYFPVEK
jgi:uncharacterized protein (TIGR02246 family)